MNTYYVTTKNCVIECHASEDEYMIPVKSVWVQLFELIFN